MTLAILIASGMTEVRGYRLHSGRVGHLLAILKEHWRISGQGE